jgi:hypothetical protein
MNSTNHRVARRRRDGPAVALLHRYGQTMQVALWAPALHAWEGCVTNVNLQTKKGW